MAVYRYVTEGSFDAYMWQALETKARFISQVMTGDNAARRAEDIGGQELSYAEVKAIASGNPAVLTLAEADAELQRLTVLKKNHADEQYLARRNLRTLPDHIATLSERLSNLTADQATAHADDTLVIGDRAAFRADAIDILGARLDALPQYVQQSRRVPLGVYHGLKFGIVLDPQFAPEVYLEGATARRSPLSREHHGPRAVLNALERLADGYGSQIATIRQELAIAEAQLRDYQARLGTAFPHESYLSDLTALRDQLKAGLSGAPQPRPPSRRRACPNSPDGSKPSRLHTPSRPRRAHPQTPHRSRRTRHCTHSPQGRGDPGCPRTCKRGPAASDIFATRITARAEAASTAPSQSALSGSQYERWLKPRLIPGNPSFRSLKCQSLTTKRECAIIDL